MATVQTVQAADAVFRARRSLPELRGVMSREEELEAELAEALAKLEQCEAERDDESERADDAETAFHTVCDDLGFTFHPWGKEPKRPSAESVVNQVEQQVEDLNKEIEDLKDEVRNLEEERDHVPNSDARFVQRIESVLGS